MHACLKINDVCEFWCKVNIVCIYMYVFVLYQFFVFCCCCCCCCCCCEHTKLFWILMLEVYQACYFWNGDANFGPPQVFCKKVSLIKTRILNSYLSITAQCLYIFCYLLFLISIKKERRLLQIIALLLYPNN